MVPDFLFAYLLLCFICFAFVFLQTPEQRRTSGDVKDGVVKRSSNARSPTSARTLVGKVQVVDDVVIAG